MQDGEMFGLTKPTWLLQVIGRGEVSTTTSPASFLGFDQPHYLLFGQLSEMLTLVEVVV